MVRALAAAALSFNISAYAAETPSNTVTITKITVFSHDRPAVEHDNSRFQIAFNTPLEVGSTGCATNAVWSYYSEEMGLYITALMAKAKNIQVRVRARNTDLWYGVCRAVLVELQ